MGCRLPWVDQWVDWDRFVRSKGQIGVFGLWRISIISPCGSSSLVLMLDSISVTCNIELDSDRNPPRRPSGTIMYRNF